MALIQDAGLAAQAAALPDTFATAQQALSAPGPASSGTRGIGALEAAPAGPAPLTGDVRAAHDAFQQEWQQAHGAPLAIEPVQYFRYVNNELVEGWTASTDPGTNLVQISQ